jgi:PPP family 3-phenylpropionic acid transporter
MPYINLYYERRGLSGVQIGFLAASILVVTSLTTIPWGAIADKFQLHQLILTVALVLAPIFIFLLSRASSYVSMIPLVLAYGLSTAPIISLLDSSALEVARLKHITYGELRVGGTMGWIMSVWLVGILIQAFDIRCLFYAYIAFMCMTLLYALSRPPRRGISQTVLWSSLRGLLTDSSIVLFLASIFLAAVGSSAVMNFFSLYLDGIGAGEGLIGLAWAVAAVSEIPVMMNSGKLMRRIDSTGLLKLAFLVYAARWLLLSFIKSPGLAVATQSLHGLSFAALLTAGVAYLNERTPQGLSTTAQAVFNVVCFGLASMVGALLGGYLFDAVGMAALLRILSLVTIAGLTLFWFTARPERTAYATIA